MAHHAEALKEKGNTAYRAGDYASAAALYGQAIQKNSSNPLLYTNRANARLRLQQHAEVIDDCLRSIELLRDNLKAYFYLAQAQLELHHPNEALTSALTAYELCCSSRTQTVNAYTISALVLRCKKAKWDMRERERLRRRNELLGELTEKLEREMKGEVEEIREKEAMGEIGEVGAREEIERCEDVGRLRVEELRNVFGMADPEHLTRRVSWFDRRVDGCLLIRVQEVPDHLVDTISFEIMHDPVITKNGNSYERATILEHLKRTPTDPITREPLHISDLRPNIALRQACEEFMQNHNGWIYDW
ncbi:U-box-domain-containing protein [Eremomyces bilateralis CBS 781.70]|uniref:E3 ubiquitin-protein ligase CHIP n=1 Tax=Eremomyces bilateralis CBS 781.70 TaxID=1392243 RepID=A0A6G1G2E6_9PEZI|nr:U-box-domain-containing protein [Eremomyces bilateralis CBS 781.70]KAF1811979.1 U-box-domain-containing protein [Eremomyces bilateralis CBS 781.70]